MPHLSVAQLWTGPAVPEGPGWRDDPEITRLVELMAARRTDLEQVRAQLAALGPGNGHSRDERLLMLFGGVFDVIDGERARIIGGVERFARKQRGLAEQIDKRETEISSAKSAAKPGDYDEQDRIEKMQDDLAWDVRIYQERQHSLSYVCESPVILEKRAFAVAQMIQAALGK